MDFDLTTHPLHGAHCIEASAGTGKTYALAGLYLRLVVERGLRVDSILVVTFTDAATQELRDRIRSRLRHALAAFRAGQGDDPLLAALVARCDPTQAMAALTLAIRSFDTAAIFTIHGFCQRMLRDNAFESGLSFDAEILPDQRALIDEIVADFWRRRMYAASPMFLAQAAAHGFSPASLADLATAARRQPEPVVLAAGAVEQGLGPLEAAFASAFAAMAAQWPQARAAVADIMANHPDFKKNMIQPANVTNWVKAMHGLCLGAPSLALCDGFDKFTATYQARALKKNGTLPGHAFFAACDAVRHAADDYAAACDCQLLALRVEFLKYLDEELDSRKNERNQLGYDDLLLRMRDALTPREGEDDTALCRTARARFSAALIDEFQDTDPIQYAIFRRLFLHPEATLFLIGDPKQAIYGFRGADIFAYLDAKRAVAAQGTEATLGENWRAAPELVEAVNTLFDRPRHAFVFRDIHFQPVRAAATRHDPLRVAGDPAAPLRLWFLSGAAPNKPIPLGEAKPRIARAVAVEAARLLTLAGQGRANIGDRALHAGDMAVLTRSNREARLVADALAELNVPCVLYGSGSLFATPEAGDMLRLLHGLAAPSDPGLVRAALATDLLGCDAAAIAALETDQSRWDAWLERFAAYHAAWAAHGFMACMGRLLAAEAVRPRLLGLDRGERRMTNVLHLLELLHRQERESNAGMAGLALWLAARMDEADEAGTPDEYQLRLESDEKAVRIVTIHKSKGLEYPIVFCPFLMANADPRPGPLTYHDARERMVFDLAPANAPDGGADATARAARENLAENMRLAYVALTRAKLRCYMAWGVCKTAATSAPTVLFHAGRGVDGDGLLDEARAVFADLHDGNALPDLDELARDCILVEPLPDAADAAPLPAAHGEAHAGEEARCRATGRSLPRDWAVSSFSALTATQDRTAPLEGPEPRPGRDEPRAAMAGADAAPQPRAAATGAPSIFDFPKGPQPGTMLHTLFERLDFAAPDSVLAEQAAATLAAYGMDQVWTPAVARMARHVLHADLAPGVRLAQVAAPDRLVELEFHFPLRRVTPAALAAFYADRATAVPPAFPERMERLDFRPHAGFLKGFVDLVFRSGDRFHLVDWKSNHLGDAATDYGPDALDKAMADHCYVLQAHLYLVALDRYLALRLPGYDYDRHMGGAAYIFLRGVTPEAPDCGIWRHCPDAAFVRDLGALLLDTDETLPGGAHVR
ncbi:MAG: exodeoxyribonuclease V subunit beta [Desulfovibrionaceae bacterium]